MRMAFVLVAAALAVSGCAPVQVAMWALDGVSYVATKKSVADHGISIVMQQDCALWRGVTEGQVCTPDAEATVIAETKDTRDQLVDPVTAWARSELAFRQSATGDGPPLSADAGSETSQIPGRT